MAPHSGHCWCESYGSFCAYAFFMSLSLLVCGKLQLWSHGDRSIKNFCPSVKNLIVLCSSLIPCWATIVAADIGLLVGSIHGNGLKRLETSPLESGAYLTHRPS